jgi:hypothetical protein
MFYLANGMGDSLDAPTPEQMESFLLALDITDEAHGQAWLSNDFLTLSWGFGLRLVFDDGKHERHLPNVSRERALELWGRLLSGDLVGLEREPWQPGDGRVYSPERAEEVRQWLLSQDRKFYDVLGEERADVPCRRAGCSRGAVEFSALCRVHHFESIRGRPSPFDD